MDSIPTAPRPQRGFVPEIDALRCFALTAIVLLHSNVVASGWGALWLFFVISGFVITRSILEHPERRPTRTAFLLGFVRRRAARILPVYVLYLSIVGGLGLLDPGSRFPEALPFLATFTYNLAGLHDPALFKVGGVGHLWSLSLEEQFYLLLPLVFAVVAPRRVVVLLLAVVALSPLIRWGESQWLGALGVPEEMRALGVFMLSPGQFDGFAAGALVAIAAHERAVTPRLAWTAVLLAVTAAALYLVVYWDHAGTPRLGLAIGAGREAIVYSVLILAAVATILAILARLPPIVWMCRPLVVRYIGRISYGGYVYHALALFAAMIALPGWIAGSPLQRLAVFAIGYTLTIALAALSFHLFERRFLDGPLGRPLRPAVAAPDAIAAGLAAPAVAGSDGRDA
ncbi:acyltransferase [Rhodoplanes sp. TEM]|uniref:Acyltransferase n=1 Tax=Rhodoplanes tepidamans TaxID=200616 RepID=A0ABT5JC57_RHOTP|nr:MULTISPECIES: acyltransferase [Rhodoplanes]MDC7787038.1 acyltransferase [Rhodoplanes tepidamans]MDC7985264.1 acyltransferase [Rhodoplanes sp. TEM]MDQ0354235.1 peptidoglycan/LPS O-acetylase OafA/YrhL [Rhodoplanes tepidamans]